MLYSPHPYVSVIWLQSGIHPAVAVPIDNAVINRPVEGMTNICSWVPALRLHS